MFVDYRKAFDMVDRSSLWQKLPTIGIDGKILRIIRNMYQNVKSCVQQNSSYSNFFNCNIGVRQRENISPLLFSIFLNDLSEFLGLTSKGVQVEFNVKNLDVFIKLYALLYADDTIIISESPKDLQSMLDALQIYCDTWKQDQNCHFF